VFLLLFIVMLFVPVLAESQVACFQYSSMVSCDGPGGNTTTAPLSRNSGIITQRNSSGSSMEPYTIIGQDRHRSGGIEPLPQIERLPSMDNGSSRSFDRREPVGSGLTPLPRLLGE
jgi:hypothetical protein